MSNLEFTGDNDEAQRNFDKLDAFPELAQFVSWGDGVPAHTPDGRQLYFRRDGGAGTTLYCWSGAAWAAFA